MNIAKKIFFTLFAVLTVNFVFGQLSRIRGTIFDKASKEPLPFVNISLKGSSVGTTSGFDGSFFIETREMHDTLLVSYIGYKSQKILIKPGTFQEIEIFMEAETIKMEEIVVNPGENPAHRVLKKIIANKKQNDPMRIEKYSYEIYNKMELDVNNISEEYKQQRIFRQFQFIFDYVDTSAITGKTFLPIFMIETLSDFYFKKDPKRQKEVIKASKISGVSQDKVSDFTGQMYLDFNLYENFVPIMGKQVVSPIANSGLMYYKYYLTDSTFRNNKWCYNISFKPRRRQEPTFTGNFWVHDTTFAIESYKIKMSEDLNINWVENFVAEQYYVQTNDSVWFPQKQELFIDFVVSDKSYGFFGRKTTIYNNIDLNPRVSPDFFSKQLKQETILQENAMKHSAMQWDSLRPINLTKREQDIYQMVDSVKNIPLFRSMIDVIKTLVTGYWIKGPIEVGPYFTLYSFNPIEGSRFRLGFRTSHKFSTNLRFTGHLAYGLRDAKFKYGAGVIYLFNKNPRRAIGGNYKLDYEQLGVTNNAFLSDNFLASLLSRKKNDKLTEINKCSVFYEHEWFQGFSNTLSLTNKQVFSSETVPFIYVDEKNDTINHNKLTTSEIKIRTRFAFNEKFVMGEFNRKSLGTKFPILTFDFTSAIQGFFNSDYEYYKLNMSIEHTFPINPLGKFRYIIDGGKILGKAPYPFLQLHEGNQTYAFDDYAFNLMNYYEFVSNEYVSLMAEHHFEGFFLNHIPLFRRLKWREVTEAKVLYGKLTQRESESLMFPKNLDNLSKPYVEAGVGIENIFRFFRVDAVWRLSYRDKENITKFGILAKMQIQF